jgi:PAS domain-containing protein
MNDQVTYQKLIEDNSFLKQRIQELEKSEAELMLTEEALRESEGRYKRRLESVTDYIYTVQVEDGRPVATAHGLGCAAVTGYTSETL